MAYPEWRARVVVRRGGIVTEQLPSITESARDPSLRCTLGLGGPASKNGTLSRAKIEMKSAAMIDSLMNERGAEGSGLLSKPERRISGGAQ